MTHSENGKCLLAAWARMDTTHEGRTTSPMQSYSKTQVAYGGVVLAVGAFLTYVLALAFGL